MPRLDNISNITAKQRIIYNGISDRFEADRTKPGNIFSRRADWKNRSNEQIESNKKTSRNFIIALRNKFGDQTANWANKQLRTHLAKGRPLSGRRAQIIIAKAETFKTKAVRQNTAQLNRMADTMLKQATQTRFGVPEPLVSAQRRTQMLNAIKTAIREAADFGKNTYSDAADFQQAFQDVANTALNGFYAENDELSNFYQLHNLIPKGAIAHREETLFDRVIPQAFGKDSQEHVQLDRDTRIILNIGDSLYEHDLTNDNLLRFKVHLHNQIKTFDSPDLSKAVAQPKAANVLKAVKAQAEALLKQIDNDLGTNALSKKSTQFLLKVLSETADIQSRIEDPTNHAAKIYGAPEAIHELLKSHIESLKKIDSEIDAGKIKTVIAEVKKNTDETLASYEALLKSLAPFDAPLTAINETKSVIHRDYENPSMTIDQKAKELRFMLDKHTEKLGNMAADERNHGNDEQAGLIDCIRSDVILHRAKLNESMAS
jgi:hypothetical protein